MPRLPPVSVGPIVEFAPNSRSLPSPRHGAMDRSDAYAETDCFRLYDPRHLMRSKHYSSCAINVLGRFTAFFWNLVCISRRRSPSTACRCSLPGCPAVGPERTLISMAHKADCRAGRTGRQAPFGGFLPGDDVTRTRSPGRFGRERSSNPSGVVRSDRTDAVSRGIPLHGPDESGHYERAGRMLGFEEPMPAP